jgi:GNAT superfamily N-acetyltransferase
MLPDLAVIASVKLSDVPSSDPELTVGVALHHRTDAIFHDLPLVRGLMRDLTGRLLHYQCSRGAARVVGHIGMELLLDAELLTGLADCEAFVAALEHPLVIDDVFVESINGRVDASPIFAVLQRFRSHGVPRDLLQTDKIVYRLNRMLAHRPRLAPSQSDIAIITRALDEVRPRYQVAAQSVMLSLNAALAA